MSNGLKSEQIRDGEVKLADLNTQESGSAVVTNVVAGENLEQTETGIDEGTGEVTITTGPNVPLKDEANIFEEPQTIDDEDGLTVSTGDTNRIRISYTGNASTPPLGDIPSMAEIGSDGTGDVHYATRPFSSPIGHRFYVSVSQALVECFRITSNGINGLLKQAKNFADPTDDQDLVTRAYVYNAMVVNNVPRINDNSVNQIYLDSGTIFNLPAAGDYVITVTLRFSHDNTGNDFVSNLNIDGTNFNINRIEPKDSAGIGINAVNLEDNITETSGTDQRMTASKEIMLLNQSAGVLNTNLNWNTTVNGVESTIYEATIRVQRLTY